MKTPLICPAGASISRRETTTPVPVIDQYHSRKFTTKSRLTDHKTISPLLSDFLAQKCLECRYSPTALVDGGLEVKQAHCRSVGVVAVAS